MEVLRKIPTEYNSENLNVPYNKNNIRKTDLGEYLVNNI